MGKIATEQEAYTVADKFIATTETKMCTLTRAIEIGCDVNGIYKSNQLVVYEDLSKAQQLFISPKIVTLSAYALNETVHFIVTCPDNYLWQADILSNATRFKEMIYNALSPKSGVGPGNFMLSSIYPGIIDSETITFNGGDAAITFTSKK